eukprot:61655_1
MSSYKANLSDNSHLKTSKTVLNDSINQNSSTQINISAAHSQDENDLYQNFINNINDNKSNNSITMMSGTLPNNISNEQQTTTTSQNNIIDDNNFVNIIPINTIPSPP